MKKTDLLKYWNIGNVSAIEPLDSYWGKTSLVRTSDKQGFILKEKPDASQTEQEFTLLSSLSNAGAPVAVPLRTTDQVLYATSAGKIFSLYPQLPGKPDFEHYTNRAAETAQTFGRAIGFLHTCFLTCDHLDGFRDMALIEQIQQWAIPCVREHRAIVDGDTVDHIWQQVEPEMVALYSTLPKQLIHRDPNPANLLFDEGQLTGFVDFDMTVRGPRIFDPCYCGSSILVGGFSDSAKVEQWPDIFGALMQGYQEQCPLTPAETQAVYGTLVTIQLLYMAFSLETQAAGAAQYNARVLNWLSANRDRHYIGGSL